SSVWKTVACSSAPSAWRVFDMFSRRRRKKPPRPCSGSSPSGGGGGGISVMKRSRQVRAMAAEDTCRAAPIRCATEPLGRGLLDQCLERLVRPELARHDLRNAVAAHAHPVQDVRGVHSALLVGDDDELRAVGKL